MNVRVFLLLICIPALLLVGCRRGEPVPLIFVLTEADVNSVIADMLAANENPLLRDPQVDLQNGSIYVTGEHDRRDGGGRISGSFRVTVAVQDGAILPQLTEVSIEGIEAGDERITQLNEQLAQDFLRRVDFHVHDAISVQSVSITDNDHHRLQCAAGVIHSRLFLIPFTRHNRQSVLLVDLIFPCLIFIGQSVFFFSLHCVLLQSLPSHPSTLHVA